MATIIMISLAIGIIFWRPPFRLPYGSKKIIVPIIMIIIVSSLMLLGSFKSKADRDCCAQMPKQINATDCVLEQTNYKF